MEPDDQQKSIQQQIADNASDALRNNPHLWDYGVRKDNYAPGQDKCNKFVYDMLVAAGADPGTPNSKYAFARILGIGSPPSSEQWADPNFEIPHWRVLSSNEIPQAGDVIAQKINGYAHATGHSGIVVGNGQTISVALLSTIIPGARGEILLQNNFGFRANTDSNPLGHRDDVIFRRYEAAEPAHYIYPNPGTGFTF